MAITTDASSGALPVGVDTSPVGRGLVASGPSAGTWRGIGGSWFNAQEIAAEDWMREEQSANNAFFREQALAQADRDFNASQAALSRSWQSSENKAARDWQEYAARNQYQWAMESMQKAGLNPILAYSQGASTPSASSGGSGGSAASSHHGSAPQARHGSRGGTDPLGSVLKLVAGLVLSATELGATMSQSKADRESRERIADWKNVSYRHRTNTWSHKNK